MSQCWPNSMSEYGVTRPQWIKSGWLVIEARGQQNMPPALKNNTDGDSENTTRWAPETDGNYEWELHLIPLHTSVRSRTKKLPTHKMLLELSSFVSQLQWRGRDDIDKCWDRDQKRTGSKLLTKLQSYRGRKMDDIFKTSVGVAK